MSQGPAKLILPQGEVWIDHRAGVITLEGRRAGRVVDLDFDPGSKRITGLTVQEGHFWHKKEVLIPVTNINRFTEGAVYLNQNYARVAHLPGIPVQ